LRRGPQIARVTSESSGKRVAAGARFVEEENTMAERQETSVMVSIQEILRDAQSREEQEKVEAEQRAREAEQRRLDDIRRRQEEEAGRLRAEEQERERRVFDEQRRQVELKALQEATIHRARTEAEAQARLAEMTARQDHERQLHALSQDKHKKRVQWIAIGLGVFFFVGAIGAGVVIKNVMDQKNAAQALARQYESEKQDVEQQQSRLKAELEQTKDPEKIAQLQRELQERERTLEDLRFREKMQAPVKGAVGPRPAGKPPGGDKPASGKPCNCTPGDPLCSCL
jgi:colicin import membrane protein